MSAFAAAVEAAEEAMCVYVAAKAKLIVASGNLKYGYTTADFDSALAADTAFNAARASFVAATAALAAQEPGA